MIKGRQGARNDLTELYKLIKQGASNIEIMEENPKFLLRLTDIDRVRQTLLQEKYKTTFRQLEVIYIWGATNLGKTRSVMEKHGYENIYRVTDYKHMFDVYCSENVLLFDEFDSANVRIKDMLNFLDGYPLSLPCRYANRQACYTKVYIISNLDFRNQYEDEKPEVYAAFLRRIHKLIRFLSDGKQREYEPKRYMSYSVKRNSTINREGAIQLCQKSVNK